MRRAWLVLPLIAAGVWVATSGAADPVPVTALPVLGVADASTVLMGAAAATGETWAYRRVPREAGVEFGAGDGPQLAFLRHTDTTGWQVADTPLDAAGAAWRGPDPNRASARITEHGGGLLVGRVAGRVSVLVREPGGRFREAPAEPALVDDGRVAAFERDGHLHALFAVPGGVLHFDSRTGAWTREPVAAALEILALDAAGTDAWLLGVEADGRFALLQRDEEEWQPRPLDLPDLPVTPLPASADPLTVTADGVWIDAALPGAADATFFRAPGGAVVSWCDAGCDHSFGARFSRRQGYRSIGFAGGARVISNPLPPGGEDEDNRGAYLVRRENAFVRAPGAGGSFRPSAAFLAPDNGWLEGPVQVGAAPAPDRLLLWPAAVRAPLTAAATAPGQPPGSLDSAALAVGQDGGVLRYAPAAGWTREFLLSSSGAVSKPLLRGVAWPEPARAHAVGDLGAMWAWRAETGLWERDPAAPVGFEGNLMGVAFQPGDPLRGYAVGKEGVLLRYDKTWTQEALPAGFEATHFTSVAFAGAQAIAAAGADLLVNDGGAWRVDEDVRRLLAGTEPRFVTVAGLPDGGAVAAGPGLVIERDGPAAPWGFSPQPLLGVTPVALAAFREGATLRALAAVQPQVPYPVPDVLPEVDPDSPAPLVPPFPLPADGYLVRETADGWRDEQRAAYAGSTADRPVKADPIAALLVDGAGEGWALGGWSGEADAAGRGNGSRSSQGRADRARVQTGAVQRYAVGAQPARPAGVTQTGTDLTAGVARFAVAGHAQCELPCADLREQALGPDRTLAAAEKIVAGLRAQPGGPRALLYTGGRAPASHPLTDAEADRYAQLLASGAPTYAAVSAGDAIDPFTRAFAGAPAPFGDGPSPAGITGVAPSTGTRTHYAFDSDGAGGRVRVIVIDNSRGSLAASDPHQNPPEPQAPWLVATLADAGANGIPAIVVGSRDLNSRFQPSLNVAADADETARLLVDGGASAYFFERPEENRTYPIPSGAATTIPAFGTGTLGYRSPLANTVDGPDAVFGDAGLLLAELDTAKRDPATNRAPVTVRLLPVISDLTLQAVDGTLLRRSRPSLFQGLGRRPVGGDRWGATVGGGDPQPPGADPYTGLPPEPCTGPACASRIVPEFEFTSSAPDIGDFVAQDPASTNLRKPLIGPDDKVVTDGRSGLFCPFNAGTTTVTVKAGGLAYSAPVTVQAGSVQRPCGTRPLDPARFGNPRTSAAPVTPPAPAPAPAAGPAPIAPPPPPPVRERPARAERRPQPPVVGPLPPPVDDPLPPRASSARGSTPTTPPPPAGGLARTIPPGGAAIRVFQENREEEFAPEQSSAAVAYRYDDHAPVAVSLYGLIVLAAFAGAALRLGPRRRGVAAATVHTSHRDRP